MAARLKAPLVALSVETPAFDALPEADRARVRSHLLLAGRLGAETLVVRGERIGDEILAAARANDVTRIVVGRPGRRRLSEIWRPNLVDWLARAAGGIDVLVAQVDAGGPPQGSRATRVQAAGARGRAADDLVALAIVAVVTAVGLPLRAWVSVADQAMLYVLGVLFAASRLSRRATIVAALAASRPRLLLRPPYFTFAVADARYLITFAVLLVTALVVSRFTVRIRAQAAAAREREQRTAALYQATRELADARDVDAIATVGAAHVGVMSGGGAIVAFLPRPDGALRAVTDRGSFLATDPKELAVAAWVHANGRPAGRGTDTLPGAQGSYLPIVGTGRPLGVLGLEVPFARPFLRQLAETIVAQTGVALERAGLSAAAETARVTVETERMRSTLLSTVSHDLRTPLASITGAAGAILSAGEGMDEATRRGLLVSIRDEGDRLGRLVSDLLDLTRLEGGSLAVRKEWYPLEEVVASALQRTRPHLAGREVKLDLPQEVLLVRIDGVLLEQVVVNLLENAAKHTSAGTPVEVRVSTAEREVFLSVLDRGPGIPYGEEERIFEEFHRIDTGRPVEGAGLGLALCRAIVHAHGGRIEASNRPGGGACFRVTLPRDDAPPAPPDVLAAVGDGAPAPAPAESSAPAAPSTPDAGRTTSPRAEDALP
jgi:two-component system sensor histidine kinase KdpD